MGFTRFRAGGHERAVPIDALGQISRGRVDQRLFDVTARRLGLHGRRDGRAAHPLPTETLIDACNSGCADIRRWRRTPARRAPAEQGGGAVGGSAPRSSRAGHIR